MVPLEASTSHEALAAALEARLSRVIEKEVQLVPQRSLEKVTKTSRKFLGVLKARTSANKSVPLGSSSGEKDHLLGIYILGIYLIKRNGEKVQPPAPGSGSRKGSINGVNELPQPVRRLQPVYVQEEGARLPADLAKSIATCPP